MGLAVVFIRVGVSVAAEARRAAVEVLRAAAVLHEAGVAASPLDVAAVLDS